MHAQRIIQELLARECPRIHVKRAVCVAAMVQAAIQGGLSLMGMSRHLIGATAIRHRIKRCDRLLANSKLEQERHGIYGAMARLIMRCIAQPLLIVDWSDLCPDRSQQLLRAALIVQGRALTVYEEVHPLSCATSLKVHRAFLHRLKALLPWHCQPIFVTDAGFRSTWFKLLDDMGFAWIGRIRNRDMVRPAIADAIWRGCKTLYGQASSEPRDLGRFQYVRSHPLACRLVLVKKKPKGRHHTTVHKKRTRSAHSKKQARAQKEPWLLAVSPRLAALSAKAIVAIYSGRMQIEQTFRDIKNAHWGLGLSSSQTRKPQRLRMLLLIGALASYALWLIGLAVRADGYRVEFGSRKKAQQALSILSLARWWMAEHPKIMPQDRQLQMALALLSGLALSIYI